MKRQVRITPYPTEDVGRLIRGAGPELFMFSSDFPHVEGGRNPLKRFESTLTACDEHEKLRFYSDNFADLMGRSFTRGASKRAPGP